MTLAPLRGLASKITNGVGKLFKTQQEAEPPPPEPEPDPAEDSKVFSYEYRENKEVGHGNPAPEVGAPSMVWHVGVWLDRMWDPSHATITQRDMEEAVDPGTPNNIYEKILNEFKDNRKALFLPPGGKANFTKRIIKDHEETPSPRQIRDDGLNSFLAKLQRKGRLLKASDQAEQFGLRPHQIMLDLALDEQDRATVYDIIDRGSIRFTLWWMDGDQSAFQPDRSPDESAIRVVVHAQVFPDYYTVSFYIDATKPWNQPAGSAANGSRRGRILDEAATVRTICDGRLASGLAKHALVPEGPDITREKAGQLLKARNYLYSDIWQHFRQSFGFELEDIVTPRGNCFVNIRGLVLSTEGAVPAAVVEEDNPLKPIARFKEGGPDGSSEADATVRAYWPFIRRITHFADVKDHIACGLMDWRALYITALGSKAKPRLYEEWDEEDRQDILSGSLPEHHDFEAIRARADLTDARKQEEEEKKQPIRYLLLMKGEPDRKQVGRMVDRINVLGTLRLFALKDWSILKNADTQIRLRGQELDAVMTWWSTQCRKLHDRYRVAEKQAREAREKEERQKNRSFPRRLMSAARIKKINQNLSDQSDLRDDALADTNQKAETYLIKISASLDAIGRHVIGGLHYRVNRSTYFIHQFLVLMRILSIGRIDTWTSYEQFVERGLLPEFEFIQLIGRRLNGLRDRLEGVTQNIQTSAMVVQAAATRKNTEVLRKIALYYQTTAIGAFLLLSTIIVNLFDGFDTIRNLFGRLRHILPF